MESLNVADEAVHYLMPSEVSAQDEQLLDRPDVAELFSRYRYAWRGTPWQFREIVSPLVRHYTIFEFLASEGLDDYSKLTLLIRRDGGQMHLVPIQNRGTVGYPNVQDNPHNIAIFNGLIAAEAMHPQGTTNWLQMAMLYLNLIGEKYQIADWDDPSGRSHAGMLTLLPKLKRLDLLPQVRSESGKSEVRIFDLHPDQSHRIEWELEFDSHATPPQLNAVTKEVQRLSEPVSSR